MKKVIAIIALLILAVAGYKLWPHSSTTLPKILFGDTGGPNLAGTGATVSAGAPSPTYDWVNPGNVSSTGASYATATGDNSFDPNILFASNFGFSIPAGATINGITLQFDRFCSPGSANDGVIQLRTGGVAVGSNKASVTQWPTSVGTATYGGIADTWGRTWTSSEINSSSFGIGIEPSQTASGSHSYSVNNVRITITYTTSGQHVTVTHTAGTLTITQGTVVIP